MEINRLNLVRLRNLAHFEFHSEVKTMITEQTAEQLNVTEAFTSYTALLTQEDKGLEIIKQNALTAKLAALDEERDSTFRGVAGNVKALTKHFDIKIKTAAEKLHLLLLTYGNIVLKNYNEETAALYNLTNDLLTTHKTALKTCGIVDWIKELQRQNEEFRTIMSDRNDAIAAQEPVQMKKLRKEVDNVYRLMVKRIEASALLNGEEAYKKFVAKLNERVAYYKEHNI